MKGSDKPTMACLFLHLTMRYSLEEAAAAVHAMEPWQIDELAPLGESAKLGHYPVVYKVSGRLTYVLTKEYAERNSSVFDQLEFTEAPRVQETGNGSR